MPLGVGRGQNVGLRDFCHILTLLPPGTSVFHKHISSFPEYSLRTSLGTFSILLNSNIFALDADFNIVDLSLLKLFVSIACQPSEGFNMCILIRFINDHVIPYRRLDFTDEENFESYGEQDDLESDASDQVHHKK